ncbi:hypothetical protein DsansV1_C24g0183251 [Dioscorea sansibarensis]
MGSNGGDEGFPFAGAAFSASVAGHEPVAPPPPAREEHGKGWEVVRSAIYDDSSIFPPSHHEGLHLRQDPDVNPSLRQDRDTEPSSPVVEKEEWVRRARRVSESARRLVAWGVELFDDKIGFSGTVWPYAAVVVAVGAVVLARRRHRKEKNLLLLLLQEKDQRIHLLLHQIELMKEIIAANHQVSILRKA